MWDALERRLRLWNAPESGSLYTTLLADPGKTDDIVAHFVGEKWNPQTPDTITHQEVGTEMQGAKLTLLCNYCIALDKWRMQVVREGCKLRRSRSAPEGAPPR